MLLSLIERSDRLRYLEAELEQASYSVARQVKSAECKRHLNEGFGRRHYMLRYCREFLERTCFQPSEKPLVPDEATEAALHLNAYYLSLRGAFDNLAWAFQFEKNLFPGVSEESNGKYKINLFGPGVLGKLMPKAPRLAKRLEHLRNWADGLRSLRDPAAHRVPLYVVPGVLETEEQLREYQRLAELAGQPKTHLAERSRYGLRLEANNVASHRPLFVVPRPGGGSQIYRTDLRVNRDHRRYLSIGRAALGAI